ncbi:MAG: hypothetical protein IT431_16965 [Phycisphaerales bacterium]|nr:hypothetical protein [Phycisphaerales bacterium]
MNTKAQIALGAAAITTSGVIIAAVIGKVPARAQVTPPSDVRISSHDVTTGDHSPVSIGTPLPAGLDEQVDRIDSHTRKTFDRVELGAWKNEVDQVVMEWRVQAEALAGIMEQAQKLIINRLSSGEEMTSTAVEYRDTFSKRLPVFLQDVKVVEHDLEAKGVSIHQRPEYRAAVDPVIAMLNELAGKEAPTYQDSHLFALKLYELAKVSEVEFSAAVRDEYARRRAITVASER